MTWGGVGPDIPLALFLRREEEPISVMRVFFAKVYFLGRDWGGTSPFAR